MSEQGWKEFLAAEGVADWVVLHGGATAVFRVSSLLEAARLAEAVAQVSGLAGEGAVLTVADDRLSVRLTRGVLRLEGRHIGLARAISAAARSHGAIADRTRVHEVQVAIAAKPDAVDVGFWRAVLGYAALDDDNAVDPLGHGSTVWMQSLTPTSPSHTRCTWTSPSPASRPRSALRRRSLRGAASWMTPTPLRAGSSPTALGTACVSRLGPTDPSVPLLLGLDRGRLPSPAGGKHGQWNCVTSAPAARHSSSSAVCPERQPAGCRQTPPRREQDRRRRPAASVG